MIYISSLLSQKAMQKGKRLLLNMQGSPIPRPLLQHKRVCGVVVIETWFTVEKMTKNIVLRNIFSK